MEPSLGVASEVRSFAHSTSLRLKLALRNGRTRVAR